MPYTPPFIGPAGLTVSNYQDIQADNVQGYLNIYGLNQYVGKDAAIYQLLSIFSLKAADCNLGLQLAYNQSSPATAVGAGLDRIVKMNGLARNPFTYSTASLTLTGTTGTVITNGFAQDVNGNLWALPGSVTIIGGTATVVATCTTPGNAAASIGQISLIASPVSGWASVTNGAAATPGVPVESDSALRSRQAISVALPSITALQSTIAAVLAVPNVTRIAPGYLTSGGPGTSIENPTDATDSWGNPEHSISMVVEGGTDAAVAQAIYGARSIGCFTNGTTSVVVTDPKTGFMMTISFFRPTYTPIMVYCTVHGYSADPTSATLLEIQAAIVAYLNELNIGETVSLGALYYEVMAVNGNLAAPAFGVRTMLIGAQAAATTGTFLITSTSVTVASATGITNGMYVFGAGIPLGTTCTISGVTLTLSQNTTAAGSSVPLKFGTLTAADVTMTNYNYVAQGSIADTEVGKV